MERLRLVLLFALRYEQQNDQRSMTSLKSELRNNRIDEEQISLLDHILSYAGAAVRGGDLFGNKTTFGLALNKMSKTFNFKGIENVYTQHTSLLKQTVDAVIKGRRF